MFDFTAPPSALARCSSRRQGRADLFAFFAFGVALGGGGGVGKQSSLNNTGMFTLHCLLVPPVTLVLWEAAIRNRLNKHFDHKKASTSRHSTSPRRLVLVLKGYSVSSFRHDGISVGL